MIYVTLIFFNCKSKCDLTDVPGSIYDIKTVARRFRTIQDIQRSLSLAQSLLKGRNAPIWRKRGPTHMTLSRTDELNDILVAGSQSGSPTSQLSESSLPSSSPAVSYVLTPSVHMPEN